MSLLSYDFSIEELQEWRLHPSIFWRGKVFLGCKLLTIEISLLRTFQEALVLYMEDLASWKICSEVVNGQSFLVIDGHLQNLF